MKSFAVVALMSLQQAQSVQISAETRSAANPIRKVVNMLEMMKKKVEAEGEKEKDMFEKFMCYCKNGAGDLQKSIDANNVKIPETQSAIEENTAQKTQLNEDLTKHRADREAAKAAMAEATSMREKEAATFAAYKAEADSNIAAIKKAVAALEKGMAGSFLQTSGATALRNIMQGKVSENMVDSDRQQVMEFLESKDSSDYAPQSGEITGILKELDDQMSKDLADTTAAENAAIKSFDGLMAAKTKEVNANTAAIEEKTVRVGEISVAIQNMKNELSDAQKALAEDTKFLGDLEKNCATKSSEWDTIVKTRADEITALSETIKMLNDDDALELFKKTLPSASASLVQIQVTSASARARALTLIKGAKSPQLNFITLALHGKKIGFEKVVAMCDDMVKVLEKEQVDDDNKKEYCDVQFDSLDDKKKALERSISDSETSIADSKEAIATLVSEINDLNAGIVALDKSVAEATQQRKEENEEYTSLMAQDTAAKELIGMAKNRMNKFYNPKMYKAPPKRELSEQDRIAVNMGGTAPPTPAPGGIAGTGITALVQDAPAPPPAAPGAYKKKGEESTGVIAMMDLLIADLDKEMTVGTQEEKDAQADYEQMMTDSADKRAGDMKSVADKGAAKADTEAALQGHEDDHESASKEHMATVQVIQATHAECDFLLQYFDSRKEARTGEIDSLKKAKAVLSGADFSLLQTGVRSLRRA
jgi:septal ring factor EnvC (AmiA/AmiB activator)